MAKTATEQAFGGKRCGLTMMVVLCVPGEGIPDGKGGIKEICQHEVHSGVCIEVEFDTDVPVFRSLTKLDVVAKDYQFVEREALLSPGTWTWKERV